MTLRPLETPSPRSPSSTGAVGALVLRARWTSMRTAHGAPPMRGNRGRFRAPFRASFLRRAPVSTQRFPCSRYPRAWLSVDRREWSRPSERWLDKGVLQEGGDAAGGGVPVGGLGGSEAHRWRRADVPPNLNTPARARAPDERPS